MFHPIFEHLDRIFDDSVPEIDNDEMIENEELDINEDSEMFENGDDIDETNDDWPFGNEAEFEHESDEALKKGLKDKTCNKSFTNYTFLKRHQRIHTKEVKRANKHLLRSKSGNDPTENLDFDQVPAREVSEKIPVTEEVKEEIDNSMEDIMEPLTERDTDLHRSESEKDNLDFEQVPDKEDGDKIPMIEEVKEEIDNSLADTDLDYTVITEFKLYERGPKKGSGRWLIHILAGPYTYGKLRIDDSHHGVFYCLKCRKEYGMFETLVH